MNELRGTVGKWYWVFVNCNYEQWSIVEFNKYTSVYGYILYELSDYDRKRLFAYWDRLLRPVWNIKYINHSNIPNCYVQIDRDFIIIISSDYIKKWDEITIDYWEWNREFT